MIKTLKEMQSLLLVDIPYPLLGIIMCLVLTVQALCKYHLT